MLVSTSEDEATRDRESREFELYWKGESADCREYAREYEKDIDKGACVAMGKFLDNSAW